MALLAVLFSGQQHQQVGTKSNCFLVLKRLSLGLFVEVECGTDPSCCIALLMTTACIGDYMLCLLASHHFVL
jgi:hypothetical protein